MRLNDSFKFLGGGAAVYLVFVACGGGGSGGAPFDAGGLLDALTDPVSEASAAPPLVVDAQCTTTVTDGASIAYYAEAQFPGKTVTELARVAVAGQVAVGFQGVAYPAGYTHAHATGLTTIRDGAVATYCGSEYQGTVQSVFTQVRFVLPQ